MIRVSYGLFETISHSSQNWPTLCLQALIFPNNLLPPELLSFLGDCKKFKVQIFSSVNYLRTKGQSSFNIFETQLDSFNLLDFYQMGKMYSQ